MTRDPGSSLPLPRQSLSGSAAGIKLFCPIGLAFRFLGLLWLALCLPLVHPAEPIQARIEIDLARSQGRLQPIWTFFGYDEPNYTYMPNGKKLLAELARASRSPIYIRMHYLLCSGDGQPRPKWGFSNVYREVNGQPVYDWTILDRIFDTLIELGLKPLVEIGFMPRDLSLRPEPYFPSWKPDPQQGGPLFTGWAYPPKDYQRWAALVKAWVEHAIERYGRQEVASWFWEVWNEPNIGYFQGTNEEYFKLYDYTVHAVREALPEAIVGGPHSTGPSNPKAADFLRRFLEHCVYRTNYATGKKGSPLDFIAFHAKGRPGWTGDHVVMGISKHLRDIEAGFRIVSSYPILRHLPVIIGESDPEGCAACPATYFPQNAYRNTTLYASYMAAVFKRTYELAEKYGIDLRGSVTWAFQFEDQPLFAGFRALATGGIGKPILNLYRMLGLMEAERVELMSTQAVPLDQILSHGVRESADINGLASRSDRRATVLLWHYHDEDVPGPPAQVELTIRGLPPGTHRVLLRQYRLDEQHSNSYTAWLKLGSPSKPSLAQRQLLEEASQLQLFGSPSWIDLSAEGAIRMRLEILKQALTFLEIEW